MIAVCGEALIDLVEREGMFEPIPGGGPFNTAVALGRLGAPVAFVGAISGDRFGNLLVQCLDDAGVDTRFVLRRSVPTPLALIHSAEDGDHDFTFYLTETAYADIRAEDLPELPDEVTALSFGTLALAVDPPAGTLEVLMRRESGRRLIVIDPNIRPAVFGDPAGYRDRFASWNELADVVKLSEDDAAWLYPDKSLEEVAQTLIAGGTALVALTLGAGGVLAATATETMHVDALSVDVVDTVGAGDAFAGGLLRWLWLNGRLSRSAIEQLTSHELKAALDFAVAVSALQCTQAGGGCPTLAEVDAFLAEREGDPLTT
jgi:fructokinase